MNKPFGVYDYVPRVRKVKHVKFFKSEHINKLEKDINEFADSNPSFKILGVRLENFKDTMVAVVTYLEDAKTGFTSEEDYYGDTDEERDSD